VPFIQIKPRTRGVSVLIYVSSFIILSIIAGAIYTNNKVKSSASQGINSTTNNGTVVNYSPFIIYLQSNSKSLPLLSDKYKNIRQKALNELKENQVYKSLVKQEIVDQKYLIILKTIGNTMISEHNDLFEIVSANEDELKKIPGAMQFVIKSVQLDMFGGVPEELLNVYLRYINAYRISGSKGTTIYHTDINVTTVIRQDFSLVEALAVFQYNYPVILDDYFDAVNKGLINWQGGRGLEYRYAYLNTKDAFNIYLKTNYPTSKNYSHYDIMTTASNLYDDYNANEVAADEKYKSKLIEVTGKIERISKDIFNDPYVTLMAGDYAVVQCSFKETKQLSRLVKGDRITIIGSCTGKMAMIVGLSDCKIF
jgi:hypothetical protein